MTDDTRKRPTPATILVVDDHQEITQLCKAILEPAGFRVQTALSGHETLEILGVSPLDEKAPLPDLIVLDIMMPMDGLTVCSMLQQCPRTQAIPIVVSTASRYTRELRARHSNVKGCIEKPFDPAVLSETISEILFPGAA